MRKVVVVGAGLGLATLLAGCAHGGGMARKGPDEYAVAREAPLVIPPDFSLVPPKPGAARPQDVSGSAQAIDALYGGQSRRSAAETGVLEQAGAAATDPGARSNAGDPGTSVVDKGSTTRDIVAAPEGDGQNARAKTP